MSEFSSKLSKGGRRKSSSSSETPSGSGTQCMSKAKILIASNSRISSPEQLPEIKSAENFVIETDKGQDCTTVSKRRRRASSSSQSKQNQKLDDPGTNKNAVTVAQNYGHLQSDDESDAEDNIEEVKDLL